MSLESLSDKELLLRCAQQPRDDSAWIEFFRRYDRQIHEHAFYTARKLMKVNPLKDRSGPADDELVCELVQEFYLHLLEGDGKVLRSFRQRYDDSIKAYWGTVVPRVVTDWFRRQWAKSRSGNVISFSQPLSGSSSGDVITLEQFVASPDANPEDLALSRAQREWIVQLIRTKSKPRHRDRNVEIYRLHFLEGMTSEEISRVKGLRASASLVRTVIRQIKAWIKEALDDDQWPA